MLRLNIRTTQPMIGIHTRLGQLEAHATPARLSTENRQARSNKGWTQCRVDIDSYPSRHSYGYDSHGDFAKEHGQQGLSDVQQATSGHTAEVWQIIDNAARPGTNMIHQHYASQITDFINKGKNRHIVAAHIPAPTITCTRASSRAPSIPGT